MLTVNASRATYVIMWERVCKALILRVLLLLVPLCACAQTPTDSAAPAPAIPASTPQVLIDPDAAPDPAPVDWAARTKAYLKNLVGRDALFETVGDALFDHVRDFPHEWGYGGVAFADRLGSEYGQFVFNQTIRLGVSMFHKEGQRYSRLGHGNVLRRTAHALAGTVVASNLHGGQTVALGQVAGIYGSWAIATQWWEPRSEQAFSRVMVWGSVGMGVKASANVLHEFWPDARNKLFKK